MTSIYHFDPIEMNASMGPLGDSREGQSEGQGSGYASQEEFETIPPISIQEVLLEAKQLPYSTQQYLVNLGDSDEERELHLSPSQEDEAFVGFLRNFWRIFWKIFPTFSLYPLL
jgi:hypothetical protein